MKKISIALICIFLALAVGLLVFMGAALSGGINIENIFGWKDSAKLVNTQTFAANSVENLAIHYSSEKIILETGTGSSIVVEEYMSSWSEDMLAKVNQSGDTVTVSQGRRKFNFGMWTGYVKVYLPAGWNKNLAVTNSSGSIKTEDDFTLGSLWIENKSGSIKLQDIKAKGNIEIQSSSGSVEVGDLEGQNIRLTAISGSVRAFRLKAQDEVKAATSSGAVKIERVESMAIGVQTSSGSIKIEELNGRFALENTSGSIAVEKANGSGNIKTSSGSIKMNIYALEGDVFAKSTSGSIKIALPSDALFTFSAKTTSGSIKTDFDDALSFTKNENNASGTVGNGEAGTTKVSCEASSGSVRVGYL